MLYNSSDLVSDYNKISKPSKLIPDSITVKRSGFNIYSKKTGQKLGILVTTIVAIVSAIVSTAITVTTSILDAERQKEVLLQAFSEEEQIQPIKKFVIAMVQIYNTELNTKRALLMSSGKLGQTTQELKNELSNTNLVGILKNVGVIQDNRRESFLPNLPTINGVEKSMKVFTGIIPKNSILLQFRQGVKYELEALNKKVLVLDSNLITDPNYISALNSEPTSSRAKFSHWKRFYNSYYGEINGQFKLFRDRCKILGIELMEFGYNQYSSPHKKFGMIIPIFKNFKVELGRKSSTDFDAISALHPNHRYLDVKEWLSFFYDNKALIKSLDGGLNSDSFDNSKLVEMSNYNKHSLHKSYRGVYRDTIKIINQGLGHFNAQLKWAYSAGIPYWVTRAYLKDVEIPDFAIKKAENDLLELQSQLLELKKQREINLNNPILNDQHDAQIGKNNFEKSNKSDFSIKTIFGKYINLNSINDFKKESFAWIKNKKNKTKIIVGSAIVAYLAYRKKR